MSEPRRSTRTRAREEAAPPPPPEPPQDTPSKPAKSSLKRKKPGGVPKHSTPAAPAAAEDPDQPPKQLLPTRVIDGQPLPTIPEPQPIDLPSSEFQDIAHSGVLNASFQRSRAVWVSGVNFRLFHAWFTPPKKVADRTEEDKLKIQRQKEMVKNFPQVGTEAQLVIEPHTFPIRLYGPREVVKKKPLTYGQFPNHNYPPPQQFGNAPPGPVFQKPSTPQQRPPPPKPPVQQPPPPQPQSQPQPGNTNTPAPDPVIHMLAQRAGTDPELKSVMKIVAAGSATKEQLEFFQGHISELTGILQKQKEEAARASRRPQPPPPPGPHPVATPPPPKSQPPPSAPNSTPQPAPQSTPQSAPQPPPPPQHVPQHTPQPQQNAPKPYSPAPPQQQITPAQPAQSAPATHPRQYGNAYNQQQQHNQYPQYPQHQQHQYVHPPMAQPQPPPPKPMTYRPLVFDFVEGNGDRFYFPSYSFMEWLPGCKAAKFSFLVTKMKEKPKSEEEKMPATPAPKTIPSEPGAPPPSLPPDHAATPQQIPLNTNTNTPILTPGENIAPTPTPMAQPPKTYVPPPPPPRIEDYDEKKDIKDIDFYQPVTVLIYTSHAETVEALPRSIRPNEVVDKYMNEVFDTCRRTEETFLAFRLPKEGTETAMVMTDAEEKKARSGNATPTQDVIMGGMGVISDKKKGAGRPRKSIGI